jgi:DNA polymerase-3 subunit delta
MTYEQIIKDIKTKNYAPIYVLAGEEAYFIDLISNFIENNVLKEDERTFNLSIFYGIEADPSEVIATARRFPMMADKNIVIIKEAQLMKTIDKIEPYLNSPTQSTILVVCHKYKNLDERTKFAKTAKKHVFFKSNKLKEADLINFIVKFLSAKNCKITPKAAQMIYGNIGDDLEKIINEISKMLLNFPQGVEITEAIVEEHIGISRSYNVFELQKALSFKKVTKATEIAFAISKDEKNNPVQAVNAALFGYFSKVLHFSYLKSKNAADIPKTIGVPPYYIGEYEAAAKNYPPQKLVKIIHQLKTYDIRSKGVDSNTPSSELIRELIFKILN